MKIKSLLLGSVAVLGLSSGAFAADPMEMLSLGICDGFGGLWNNDDSGTTNPNYEGSTHCVRVTGGASIEVNWGDYNNSTLLGGVWNYNNSTRSVATPSGAFDWSSKVEAWMRWIGIANASTGPVAAVIKFKEVDQHVTTNQGADVAGGDDTGGVILDEGYAQALIGDSLWIAGGKKGSIRNVGDDDAFTVLQPYNSDLIDKGVSWWAGSAIADGGHVLQGSVDLGNGLVMKASLENIQGDNTTSNIVGGAVGRSGTAYGVLEYTGSGFTGHATVAAGGVFDGTIESFAAHLAGTATFDMVKLRAAFAGDSTFGVFSYNGLASAEIAVDSVTFALAGEVASYQGSAIEYGGAASVVFAVSDDITLKVAGRVGDPNSAVAGDEIWQGEGVIAWAATDTLTLTLTGGAEGSFAGTTIFYGAGELGFDAGGGFTASAGAKVYSNGAFKGTVKVADDII